MLQPGLLQLVVAECIWYNGMKLPLEIVPEGSRWKSWSIEQPTELSITSRDGCSSQGSTQKWEHAPEGRLSRATPPGFISKGLAPAVPQPFRSLTLLTAAFQETQPPCDLRRKQALLTWWAQKLQCGSESSASPTNPLSQITDLCQDCRAVWCLAVFRPCGEREPCLGVLLGTGRKTTCFPMGETIPDTNSYPRKAGMHPNPGSTNHPAAVLSMELGVVLGRAGHFPELPAMLLVCSQNLSLVAVCFGRCPIGLQGETSCSYSHPLIIPKASLRQHWHHICYFYLIFFPYLSLLAVFYGNHCHPVCAADTGHGHHCRITAGPSWHIAGCLWAGHLAPKLSSLKLPFRSVRIDPKYLIHRRSPI